MATLFNTKISQTYEGLLKTIDNASISATLKELTDGSGNQSGLYLNTAGDFKVSAILEWGSLKDTGTGVTITRFVTSTDGIENFDNNTSLPTSAAVKLYVDTKFSQTDTLQEVLGFGNTTGGNDIAVSANDDITFTDSSKILMGASSDLQIYHDGSHSYIKDAGTGNLRIWGSEVQIQNWGTGAQMAKFVAAAQVELSYDGTKKFETTLLGATVTGDLLVTGTITGAGGSFLPLAGGTMTGDIVLNDGVKTVYGTANDGLWIYHDGSNSYINDVGTGDLYIRSNSLAIQSPSGNETIASFAGTGGQAATLYAGGSAKLATTNTGVSITGALSTTTDVTVGANATFVDNGKAIFGAGSDLQIYHDGGSSLIRNLTGGLYVETSLFQVNGNGGSELMIKANENSSVELYYNAIKKFETLTDGAKVTGNLEVTGTITGAGGSFLPLIGGTMTGNTIHNDNVKSIYGTASDGLEIYHDSSNSYIKDTGTGNLFIDSSNLYVRVNTNEFAIKAFANSRVELYHDNTKKLETSSTGISVTGGGSFSGEGFFSGGVQIPDSSQLKLGSSSDFKLYHDGFNSYLRSDTGTLYFEQAAVTQSIIFNVSDANSLDTTALTISRNADASFGRDVTIAGDLTVNGTTTTVNSQTLAVVDPLIQLAKDNTANSLDIGMYGDYNDGTDRFLGLFSDASDSNKFKLFKGTTVEPTTTVDIGAAGYAAADLQVAGLEATTGTFSGTTTFNDHSLHPDQVKSKFGNNGDLEIYHDGSNSFIQDTGTGSLKTVASGFQLLNATQNQFMILADGGVTSWVKLYYAGSERLATTSTGVSVAGGGIFTGNTGIFGAGSTSTPSSKLSIGGNAITTLKPTVVIADTTNGASLTLRGQSPVLFFDGTAAGVPKILMDGQGIEFKDGTLDSEGSVHLKIDSSGNVGIGTDSPDAKLDVNGGLNSTHAIFSGQDGRGLKLSTENNLNNDDSVVYDAQTSSGSHLFKVNGSEKMRIDSAGNVGIGTTSPAAGLQVAKGGTIIPTAGASTSSAVFGNSSSDDNYGLAIGANSSGVGYISSQRTDGIATTYNLAIQPNGGSVGIGTASPSSKFSVVGNDNTNQANIGHSTQSVFIKVNGTNVDYNSSGNSSGSHTFSTGNAERMRITSAGNVGIGTDSPSALLEVASVTGANIRLTSTGNGLGADNTIGSLEYYGSDISAPGAGIKSSIVSKTSRSLGDDSNLIFSTSNGLINNVERVRIDLNGNVGIGTDNPTKTLDIRTDTGVLIKGASGTTSAKISFLPASGGRQYDLGNVGADFRIFDASANVTRMYFDNDGNTGIGTTTPDFDLDVERTATTVNDDPTIRVRNAWATQGNNTGFSNRAAGLYSAGADSVITKIQSRFDTGFNLGEVGTATNHDFRFITNGNERMRIDNNGNFRVGGASNPETDLQIYNTTTEDPAAPGTTTTGKFCINSSQQATLSIGKNAGNEYWISNVNRSFGNVFYNIILNPLGGKIGIGKTTPNATLDVNGDIQTTGNQANTLEFSTFFSSGTTTIATLSNPVESTVAVANIEYVGLYAFGGTQNVGGIIMAITRYNNTPTWSSTDDQTVSVFGSTSKEPTLFWDNGVLKLTVPTSVQITGRIRITYHDSTLTRNHAA